MPHASQIRLEVPTSASFAQPWLRTLGRVLALVLTVVTTLAITAALAVVVAALFGIHPRIEQSGSMAPALRPGDLLFVKSIRSMEARPGEILTFPAPDRPIELTHRAISIKREGRRVFFVTRGDANTGVERWSVPAHGTIGREVLVLPAVGGAIQWLRGVPLVLTIWLVAPFLLLWLLRRIWRGT